MSLQTNLVPPPPAVYSIEVLVNKRGEGPAQSRCSRNVRGALTREGR